MAKRARGGQRSRREGAGVRGALDALLQSEQRLRALFEDAGEALFLVGIDGRFVDVNQRACLALGYTREELLELSVPDINPVYPREKLEEFVRDLKPNVPVTLETTHQRKDGSTFPVEVRTGLVEVQGESHILSFVRDITERKRAEREIESLAKFPSENPNPVLRIAEDGMLLYANPACGSLLDDWGWCVGQPVADEWRGFVREVLRSGEVRRHEVEHRNAILSFEIAPVQGAGYANAYGRDITERRRAEREIESLARFPSENPNPVLRIAGDGTLLHANAACRPLLDDWRWCVGQPVADEWRDIVSHVLASGEASRYEVQHRDAVLSFEIAPVPDARYANAYGRDITERKRAEDALARQTEIDAAVAELASSLLAQLSFEDVSDLVLACAKRFTDSPSGFVGYIEPATGYLISATMTRDVWDLCEVEDKDIVFKEFHGLWGWVLHHREPLVTNTPSKDIRSGGTPEGHIPIERFLSVPALAGDMLVGQVALANAERDYTDRDVTLVKRIAALYAIAILRMRAEHDLKRVMADLERSNADLDQFARVAAHDLQAPLATMGGYVNLLQRRYGESLDEDARSFLAGVMTGIGEMEHLIHDILTYSRVDTNESGFAAVACSDVFREALKRLQAPIEESQAVITHDPFPVVTADQQQFVQLFQNLLGNALKFRGEGFPAVHVGVDRNQDHWVFSVRDNGVGIPAESHERVFTMFERLHAKSAYPGTGIGLAICRRIVERHGGRIWVESEPGQGSTFYFTIPEGEADQAAEA